MHLVLEMFHLFVREHPFVDNTPHLSEQAEEVSDALGAMYQAIGIEYDKYYNEDNTQ
jgi:CRISPR/Cas system-associated protein Cas7 (RAMP superfamily)